MPTERALSGVAHDIAHHVEGPYVYIYPTLVRLCKAAGVRNVAIELLSDNSYPTEIGFDPDLSEEIGKIRERLWTILDGYQFQRTDLRSVRLDVELEGLLLTAHPSRRVHATVTSSKGKVYESTAGKADV